MAPLGVLEDAHNSLLLLGLSRADQPSVLAENEPLPEQTNAMGASKRAQEALAAEGRQWAYAGNAIPR